MLIDARNSEESLLAKSADTVIIGGGTVGIFLAIVLSRAKKRVLIVEGGGMIPEAGHRPAESRGRIHTGLTLGRAFGLGGTSMLWGGQLAEFDAADLNATGREWPITHRELTSLYQSVYEIFGIRRLEEADYRAMFGDEKVDNSEVERFFTHWLRQPNFSAFFKDELKKSRNLTIMLNANVTGFKFETERAKSLSIETSCGRQFQVKAKNFVLACGTIENSRLLLSLKRDGAVPWINNNNIGNYFQDHIGGSVAKVIVHDQKLLRNNFENAFSNGFKIQPKIRLKKNIRKIFPIGISGEFIFDSSIRDNFANIKTLIRSFQSGVSHSNYISVPKDIRSIGRSLIPIVVRYVKDHRVMALYDKSLDFYIQSEQIPLAASRIALCDRPKLKDGLFPVEVDWKIDGAEIGWINKFCKLSNSYLRDRGIGELCIESEFEQGGSGALARMQDTYHQCGGTCMSLSSSGGVTDRDCRIWGTDNVFVAGASLFPTSSHANCTLTSLALGTRLASRISALP